METIFLKVLNQSISAGWLILAVCLLRLVFRRMPRWIVCLLWGIVGIRLICPFTFESVFSLIPSAHTVPQAVLYGETPRIQSGIPAVNDVVNPILTAYGASAPGTEGNRLLSGLSWAAGVWAAGALAIALYGLFSYARLRMRLRTAVLWKENIWQSEQAATPFVFGLFRPRIYLPFHMKERDTEYVLAHERAHIRRGDHVMKLVCFALLAVFWFHPLCWAAYVLSGRDMEAACDEKVVRNLDLAGKREYMTALLHFGEKEGKFFAYPLAFGEIGIKERVKNVLRYHKPAAAVTVAGVAVCIAAAVCFLSSPVKTPEQDPAADPTQNPVQEQGKKEETLQLPVVYPAIAPDMTTGADGAVLDYDGDRIIFHGYFGLFVFDPETGQLTDAVDLKAIGCDATQGDDACEVAVEKGGGKVYLHPMSSNMMYVYDVEKDTLLQTADDMGDVELYDMSREAQGVLTSADETLAALKYVKDGQEYVLFQKVWEEWQEQLQIDILYEMQIDEESVTASGLTFTIVNRSGSEIVAGDSFQLRKRQEGAWVDVEYLPESFGFHDIGYPVAPGESREFAVNWEWLYGTLEPGSYCIYKEIVTDFGDNYGTYTLEADFEIE